MKRFTNAGRQAVDAENWYAALTLALTIPDICASLENPGTGKSRESYERWCRNWLEPKFTRNVSDNADERVLLSAEDIYQARCSIVHSGSAEIDPKRKTRLDKFEFFSGGAHMNNVNVGYFNGVKQQHYLQLRVDRFCESVFLAAEEWDESVSDETRVQDTKKSLLVIHNPGAQIGGVTWR